MRVALIFAYDGTAYRGFETQKDLRTVQGELNTALKKLYGEDIATTPSGRTDAGVHALAQVVHYDCAKEIAVERIVKGLNFYLPEDIRIKSANIVPKEFNARMSAKKKTYRYDMYIAQGENPLLLSRAHRLTPDTDLVAMQAAAALFIGEHDFKQFYCIGSSAKTTIRTVFDCRITFSEQYGEQIVSLTVSANGFLYKMVRLIVGALIKVGQGKLSLSDITDYLNNEKTAQKTTAPACGLYLLSVEYK